VRASVEDQRVLARINLPADERYETSVRMKSMVLVRLWRWAERVGATDLEVARVSDSLGLSNDEVKLAAEDYSHSVV
jgi:hypothetical protein